MQHCGYELTSGGKTRTIGGRVFSCCLFSSTHSNRGTSSLSELRMRMRMRMQVPRDESVRGNRPEKMTSEVKQSLVTGRSGSLLSVLSQWEGWRGVDSLRASERMQGILASSHAK